MTKVATKTATVQARVEPQLKKKSEAILKRIGLSTSDLISMTLHQVVLNKGLPFEARIPNQTTIDALNEDLTNAKKYTSVENMIDDILGKDR